ncbi:YheC/YheD family protein [Hazenella sp. IB182357]|uniref:YheC/YheD family protein n=1 Tax=Polycladospora coralii TaxID=2771432 RepID=A0A926N6K1_9BACL|nr:YheC/YheD family protein [Polycladospora coralii]MBD1373099.1 YheC/YheD family protein [Polycladospora coralii]MBS7529556.1 YheC/YheD family protein [Polycladospora coralii]
MALVKVQLQIIPDRHFPPGIHMVMSRLLAKKLEIKTNPFWIKFGSATQSGMTALSRKSSNLVLISFTLASQLNMTDQVSINAHFNPKSVRLKLGPILGILMNPHQEIEKEKIEVFGLMSNFLSECAQVGKSRGLVVMIFTPREIEVGATTLSGWILDNGMWKKTTLPLPDTIYNRITSRKIEQQQDTQDKLNFLKQQKQIPIFNEMFLNKFEVYQILVASNQIRKILPETRVFHATNFKEMSHQYPVLYLKPDNGSLGSGIIRITHAGGKWVYESATPNGTLTKTASSLVTMSKMLSKRIGKQAYLVQQGLYLVKYDGNRQVDFRVLAQKNSVGKWQITSAVGRIANDQHIVSNLARGGTIRKASDVLAELKLARRPSITQLKSRALEIANAFDELVNGHFAELGIDLAIDVNGYIWLIEINSKPSKTNDTVIDQSVVARPSVMRLMDYVLYLAGMSTPIRSTTNKKIPTKRRKSL